MGMFPGTLPRFVHPPQGATAHQSTPRFFPSAFSHQYPREEEVVVGNVPPVCYRASSGRLTLPRHIPPTLAPFLPHGQPIACSR